jgi:hypothetical protein
MHFKVPRPHRKMGFVNIDTMPDDPEVERILQDVFTSIS